MTYDVGASSNYRTREGQIVYLGDNSTHNIHGQGDVHQSS
jgi:hypothetical protein